MCMTGSQEMGPSHRNGKLRDLPSLDTPKVVTGCGALRSTSRGPCSLPIFKQLSTITTVVSFAFLSVCAGWAISSTRIVSHAADLLSSLGIMPLGWSANGVQPWDAKLCEMRKAAGKFKARTYKPPFWARNAHMHTIVSSGDFERRVLGDRKPLAYWRERWSTPDGDFVDIDWLPAEENKDMDLEDAVDGSDEADDFSGADIMGIVQEVS
ncbi:unnamed protein product [Choristocarpus tenellus]